MGRSTTKTLNSSFEFRNIKFVSNQLSQVSIPLILIVILSKRKQKMGEEALFCHIGVEQIERFKNGT